MTKTQVYLEESDLEALHRVARATGRSVADLIREAIRTAWVHPEASGPVALWKAPVATVSVDHDRIYDAP